LAVVELASAGNRLVLCVSDNGNGFDIDNVDERAGLGLISMRERLRLIKGQLSIQSAPHGGTRIRVEVPLDSPVVYKRVTADAGAIPARL
jgi:signal transduction histidine kinase